MPAREVMRRAAGAGLVGGVVVVYLGAVGMIEKFDRRNLVSDVVTLGKLLIALPPFLAAYVATRPRVRRGQYERIGAAHALAGGTVCGLLAGAVTYGALALGGAFEPGTVRAIFVSVSPTLLSIVAFGQPLGAAAVVLLGGGAVLGAAGAGFRVLPESVRRPLTAGLIATLVMALLQRIIPVALGNLHLRTDWLYSFIFQGLTTVGAILVFVVSVAVAIAWRVIRDRMRHLAASRAEAARASEVVMEPGQAARAIALLLVALIAAVLPWVVGSNLTNILGQVAIFLLMGLGLNIVVGYAGLLDLGYVAFFAVGAYMTALLTGAPIVTSLGDAVAPALSAHLSFYAALPLVILAAAFVGVLIGAPVLRLRGDYLAIVTLGFGEIARVLVTSDWLKPVVGGAQGLRDITPAPIGGISFRDPQTFYYLALAFVLLAVYVSTRLANSRIGRAWNAMREDEQVAEAMGISTVRYKLLAFAMGAAVGCLSGALFAVQIGSLNPSTFNILVSITALAVIILGGMGSIPGVLVGGLVLIGIPRLLTEFEEYALLLYGAVLVAIMVLRPQGLIPNVRRSRELHEEEVDQDAWLKRSGDASVDAEIAIGAGGGAT